MSFVLGGFVCCKFYGQVHQQTWFMYKPRYKHNLLWSQMCVWFEYKPNL